MIKFESLKRLLNVTFLYHFVIFGNNWITGLRLCNFYENAHAHFLSSSNRIASVMKQKASVSQNFTGFRLEPFCRKDDMRTHQLKNL